MDKVRILIAKPGLDGHDRGAKVIAKYLRDAGMEVIYSGLRQTPETIVNTAIQEDVHAVGLSILSGAHLPLCNKLFDGFKRLEVEPPLVFVGGIIPQKDALALKKLGVQEVFFPGQKLNFIYNKLIEHILFKYNLDISV